MIKNASDSKIYLSNMPSVEDALSDWMRKILLGIVTKTVSNYRAVESIEYVSVMAVKQPFTSKQLMIKPEGQRAWSWVTLHVKKSDYELQLDDKIIIDSLKYRVMQKFEWQDNGFIEYQIIEDWGQEISSSIAESVSLSDEVANDIS